MNTCPNKEECLSETRRITDEAAHAAADCAVKKVFNILGVDVDKAKEVEEFREDLRFGRRMRRAADRSFLVMVSVVAAALVASLWLGIVANLVEKIKP